MSRIVEGVWTNKKGEPVPFMDLFPKDDGRANIRFWSPEAVIAVKDNLPTLVAWASTQLKAREMIVPKQQVVAPPIAAAAKLDTLSPEKKQKLAAFLASL